MEVNEPRAPGTFELAGVAPAGHKRGTAVAAGLIWEGPRLCSKVARSGQQRRHIAGIVRLPVVRPDLGHQTWKTTPQENPFHHGFRAQLADVGWIISVDGDRGPGFQKPSQQSRETVYEGSGHCSPGEVRENGQYVKI